MNISQLKLNNEILTTIKESCISEHFCTICNDMHAFHNSEKFLKCIGSRSTQKLIKDVYKKLKETNNEGTSISKR